MLSLEIEFALCLALISCCVAADDPVVDVASGQLVGETIEFSHGDVNVQRTVHVFKGIPYAEPPVGDLRFQPPQTKVPWEGVYNATEFGSICIQPLTPFVLVVERQNEDCLFLNVYAPQTQTDEQLPVMVWIHGGGFTTGSGSVYNGLALSAIAEVIVVTINYRLGALGYFSTGDERAAGNYGSLDQIAALQWVQENIAAFGGDADKVTVFGESAGSMSIDFMLFSPLTDGLFHRAILQSGTATLRGCLRTDADLHNTIAHGLGKLLGCERDTSQELVQCLQTVPADDFRDPSDTNKRLIPEAVGETIIFSLFLDGHFLTETPTNVMRDGSFTKTDIDILIGTNADEGTFFVAAMLPNMVNETEVRIAKTQFEGLDTFFLSDAIKENTAAQDAVKLMYVDWATADSNDANYAEALSQIVGDQLFVCPADLAARAYSDAGASVYRYFMTHIPAKSLWSIAGLKATHGEEIPFVFGSHFLYGPYWIMPEEEINMTLTIMTYWSNFAKTGNPNLPGVITREDWPLFKVPGLAYKELSPEMKTKEGIKATECAFWHDYIPKLLIHTEREVCEICTSGSNEAKASVFVFVVGLFFLIVRVCSLQG